MLEPQRGLAYQQRKRALGHDGICEGTGAEVGPGARDQGSSRYGRGRGGDVWHDAAGNLRRDTEGGVGHERARPHGPDGIAMPLQNLIGLGGVMDQYAGLPPRQDPADALGRQALGLAEETGNAGLGEEFLASQWRNGGPDIDPSTLAMLRLLQKQQRAPLTALEGAVGAVGGEPTERFGDTLLRLGKTGELEAVGQDFVPDLKTDTTRQYAAYRDAVAQRARTSGVMGRGAGEDFAMAPAAPRDARGQTPGGPVIGIKGVNKNLPKMTPEQEQKILAALQSKQIEREAKRAGLSEDLAEARRLFQSGVRGQGLQGGRLRREQREQTDLARNEERTFAKEADREARHQQGVMDFWRNKQFEIEQQGTKLFERLRDSGVSEADAQAAV